MKPLFRATNGPPLDNALGEDRAKRNAEIGGTRLRLKTGVPIAES